MGLLLTPSTIDVGERSKKSMDNRFAYRKKIGRNGVSPGCLSEQPGWAAKGENPHYKTMIPTASSRDYKGASVNNPYDTIDSLIETGATKNQTGQKTGLKLQPNFVEWMMGYPLNYTNLNYPKVSTEKKGSKR
jgi:hypothetical protein